MVMQFSPSIVLQHWAEETEEQMIGPTQHWGQEMRVRRT